VSVLPREGKTTAGVILPLLNTIGRSSYMKSLERMTCLVDRDNCNSSVPHAWASVVMVSALARC